MLSVSMRFVSGIGLSITWSRIGTVALTAGALCINSCWSPGSQRPWRSCSAMLTFGDDNSWSSQGNLKEALMFDIDACEAASDPLHYMHTI